MFLPVTAHPGSPGQKALKWLCVSACVLIKTVACKWNSQKLNLQALSHGCNALTIAPHTHTHPFNGPLSGTTQMSRYQKGKTNLDFTEARDSGWQWHQLGYMQVCTSLQTDDHTSTPPLLCFLQAGCPSCRPTNSIKALKAL